jgi:lysophospholipase L1-like esterase
VAYEEKDRTTGAPLPGGIVFVGSSSIVNWRTLAADFPGLSVINRGFGGTEIQDSTYYAARIIFPYKPRTIVFYAGDNDISAGHTNEQVVGDFQTFARKVRAALPDTKILFLAIKPSPSRWKLENRMVVANKAIADWIATQPNMGFIDVHTPMLGADGMPRPELYGPDKLHMTAEGYRLWTSIVAPYLK